MKVLAGMRSAGLVVLQVICLGFILCFAGGGLLSLYMAITMEGDWFVRLMFLLQAIFIFWLLKALLPELYRAYVPWRRR